MVQTEKTESQDQAAELLSPSTYQAPPARIVKQSKSLEVDHLSAWYGSFRAVRDVTMDIQANRVTALIGPSGCGKSTLIRTFNRMHEVTPGAKASGSVMLDGEDIYAPTSDATLLRRRVGMVFQRPNPFPTMSIFDNVCSGLKLNRIGGGRKRYAEIVEKSLTQAALFEEVKDKLNEPATSLSGGQQQRLCIARALAVEPDILLMDEPCSALDPIATLKIEDLMRELVPSYTIVIVTHNMQQAARVSDATAFMLMGEERAGELVEFGETKEIFTNPKDQRTEGYITGRFG